MIGTISGPARPKKALQVKAVIKITGYTRSPFRPADLTMTQSDKEDCLVRF